MTSSCKTAGVLVAMLDAGAFMVVTAMIVIPSSVAEPAEEVFVGWAGSAIVTTATTVTPGSLPVGSVG